MIMKTYQVLGCESHQLKYCQNTSKLQFIRVLLSWLQVAKHEKEK